MSMLKGKKSTQGVKWVINMRIYSYTIVLTDINDTQQSYANIPEKRCISFQANIVLGTFLIITFQLVCVCAYKQLSSSKSFNEREAITRKRLKLTGSCDRNNSICIRTRVISQIFYKRLVQTLVFFLNLFTWHLKVSIQMISRPYLHI